MLTFAVYHQGVLLEQWPSAAAGQAYAMYLTDAENRPQERAFDREYGRLIAYCPPGVRRRLFIRYAVTGFGDPVLHTRLLQSGEKLHNLAVELALGRIETLEDAYAAALLDGVTLSSTLIDALNTAQQLTMDAVRREAQGKQAAAAARADEALAVSVPAGETLALEVAQAGLQERMADVELSPVRFGCGGFGVDGWPQQRQQYFLQAVNYATLPFYLSGMEPEPGRVEHDAVLRTARFLRDQGVALKGHPLVWTFNQCLPAHRRGMDFATCCDVFRERIRRDVPPFAGFIDTWDIINEAHDTPWANSLGFSSRQLVELTALAAETTRAAAPESKLVVNVCLPFGEYAAGAPGRVTTLEYLRSCLDADIDFDVIGIQLYYGGGQLQYCWDMLEISRLLDEYVALGKEIHITELGTPSANGADPNAMIAEENLVGFWHGAWSDTTQADWVEQFYRICLAKPAITAMTWWSFSDAEKVFWPYSGLLNISDTPKESFRRLCALREEMQGVTPVGP